MLIEKLKDNVGVLQRSTIKSLLNLPTFSRNGIKFSSIHPWFVGLNCFAWKGSAACPPRCAKGDFFAACLRQAGLAPLRDKIIDEVLATPSQIFIISIKNRHGSSGSIFPKKWRE
jgi:hypothetical protein